MAHLTLLLVLLWVGATVSTVVDVDKRIIGGQQCTDDERPYHVKLVDKKKQLICGGSLIRNRWILTSAYCNKGELAVIFKVHPESDPVTITTQPQGFLSHDIMLVKLPEATKIPDGVKPIDLPDCSKTPKSAATVQIAGHASTKNNKCGESPTLQCANVNVVDYRNRWFWGQAPGVAICHGDSGGGVVYNNRLYGVVSFSVDEPTKGPVRFTNLCDAVLKQWMQKIIDQ